MKRLIASLALGFLLVAILTSGAMAQNQDTATTANTPGNTAQSIPNVESESLEYLKQNQAERTRDQPRNLSPTYRIAKQGTKNYSSLPALEAGVLIQPKARFPGQAHATTAGEAWRNYRNGPLTQIGGWLLAAAVLGMVLVYFIFGQIKLKRSPTGQLIERFTAFERTAHWTAAICFVILAATGLTMLFGRYVILPLFGHALFGWFSFVCKNIHNFVGPLFTVSLVIVFLIFVKDNFPLAQDLKWLSRLGGMFGGQHVSSGRFNGGEKGWFWVGVVLLGLVVSGSGFVLNMLVPGIEYSRGNLQIASVIHIIGTVLFMTIALGHIYMGTIGMEGAYKGMATGFVDDEWAKEHHDLWYDDVQSGRIPRIRTEEMPPKPVPRTS